MTEYRELAETITDVIFGNNTLLQGSGTPCAWARTAFCERVESTIAGYYLRRDATRKIFAACKELTAEQLETICTMSEKLAAKARAK